MKAEILLGALLFVGLSTSVVPAATDEASFSYYYIVANEGASSGGHTAVRFGNDVYHFQNENGLLVLQRDSVSRFHYLYTLLGNRAVHASEIGVSRETHSQLVEAFRQRHRAGEAQFRFAQALRRDVELLRYLSEGGANRNQDRALFGVRGLGYFAALDAGGKPREPILDRLHARVADVYGSDYLHERRRKTQDEIRRLIGWAEPGEGVGAPDSVYEYPPFVRPLSDRWKDLRGALAALDVLEQAPVLAEQSYHAPRGDAFVLDAGRRRALERYAQKLERELVELTASKREDWGQTFLVGAARLVALRKSLASGSLVFLDTFPEEPGELMFTTVGVGEELRPMMVVENRDQLEAAFESFVKSREPDEVGWERIEERSNRYREILHGGDRRGRIRVARGHLVPVRSAFYSLTQAQAGDPTLAARELQRAVSRRKSYERGLRRLHRYDVLTQNCSTALFDTINFVFGDSEKASTQQLGGYVGGSNSLSFIPFVSADQVNARYRVRSRRTYASFRQLRLQEMKSEESSLWVSVRESNTFTSQSYRRSANDSFFVFFTDEASVLRPLFGIANLAAGVTQTAVGLVTAPLDRSRMLRRGLRGAFVSLPELAFSNIRKGSYEWVPMEYRKAVAR